MAEEEKPDGADVQQEAKSRKWLWIVVAAMVFLAAGAAGAYFLGYLPGTASAEDAVDSGPTDDAGPQPLTDRVKSVMKLDAFLVNLADPDGARFLKATFHLGLDQPKVGEQYAGDPVVLAATRDRINSILSTKTAEEILSPEGKDALRREIRDILIPVFPAGKVVDVYILDFVVQL